MNALDLLPHEIQALRFLEKGPDCIGLIDDESKLAAALMFVDLKRRGLVTSVVSDDGPIWSLSDAGIAALKRISLQ